MASPSFTLERAPATRNVASQLLLPHIQVHGVSKAFGDRQVLRNLDLEIAQGEFVAVIGRSGCGKSTLLRLLAGLEAATSGEIWVRREGLRGVNRDARIMFQDARLLPWERVLENVGIGLTGAWKTPAEEALRDVGLQDRAQDWPSVLSGGQRQRVALARALASHPEILLLDEPLGALDALTRRDMQKLIERLWQQHAFTTLLVTHDAEEAVALADRVILLDEGRVAMDLYVPLERPRNRASAAFVSLREQILEHIHNQD